MRQLSGVIKFLAKLNSRRERLYFKFFTEIKYFFVPLLPKGLPEGFSYSCGYSHKDHLKKEIINESYTVKTSSIEIYRTTRQYEAGSVYENPVIISTTIEEEKLALKKADVEKFWMVLRMNKFANFPSPEVHNSHDSTSDQSTVNNLITLVFQKSGMTKRFDIYHGHDNAQGGKWLARLNNIRDAEGDLVRSSGAK